VVINAILHSCRRCGQPVPVNGLVTRTTCPGCQADVEVPASQWRQALRAPNVGTLLSADATELHRSPPRKTAGGPARLAVDWRVAAAPPCLSCGELLEASDATWRAPEPSLQCGGCGGTTRFAAPGLDVELPTTSLTHVAALEGAPAPAGVAATADDGRQPIAMSCPSCAAGLHITVEDQRTTTCAYCNASVYIPDALWRQLHPAKRAEDWNAIFHVTPTALREAGTRAVGCTLGLIAVGFGGLLFGLTAGLVGAAREGFVVPAVICGVLLLIALTATAAIVGSQVSVARRYRRLAARWEREAPDEADR